MVGAERLSDNPADAIAIAIDANALEAGDEAVINDTPVQIVDPAFESSPDPSLEMAPDPALAVAQDAAPAAISTPAAAAEPRTAARTIAARDEQAQAAPKPPAPKPPAAKKKKAGKNDFVIKSILDIDGPIKYGEWFWDDEGVPPGKLVMTVDLDARVISVFRGGHEIGAAAVLLGTQKHPTPLGTFPILTKEKDNVSEKYNNAPMPWSLRLTWDGIMIHGSPVQNGYASHGCVGTPNEFAEKLFAVAKRGDKVIITRGEKAEIGDKLL